MNVHIKTGAAAGQAEGKTAVLFVFREDAKSSRACLNPYKEALFPLFKEKIFKGERKTSLFLPFALAAPPRQKGQNRNLALVGLGGEKTFSYEMARRAAAKALKELEARGQSAAALILESLFHGPVSDWKRLAQAVTEGAVLAGYKCREFKKPPEGPEGKKPELESLALVVPPSAEKPAKKGAKEGEILGAAVNFAKKLANYPGNLMTPSILAGHAQKETENSLIKTTVWDKRRIQKEKMGGLLGVSLGSSEEPRFIIMEYKGAAASKKPICLVGKGLTFDSGGISLKPGPSMDEMKFDMCGGAAVTGAMLAIEKLKLKVNVLGLVPSSENMPGQSANKPGDILKARNGKTMEVLNTDAEGRLILADALSYASEQKPAAIFDAATLTGAISVCLSNIFTGFFTKDSALAKRIKSAAEISGERMWQLPLVREHAEDIKSAVADVANISSGKGGGSSTAAAFLEHFVDKGIPWAHFDIAGTAWNAQNRLEYCEKRMATGVMVRSFVEMARSYE